MIRPLSIILRAAFCLVAAFSAGLGAARASLAASPIIIEFVEGRDDGRQDITVKNTGLRVQYLEITPYRIETPGAVPENLMTDPDPEKVGLLVAPRRITLRPSEEKVIRVIKLAKAERTDLAWRVGIKPIAGEIGAEESGVVVLIGYQALVFARPPGAQAELRAVRKGSTLEIVNAGATNALLFGGRQCSVGGECVEVKGKRLWPGDTWTTTLPRNGPAAFDVLTVGGGETLEIK